MPKGPQGQWRPAEPVACAVHAGKIATGEIQETHEPPAPKMPQAARKMRGLKGGRARADTLTPERRHEIAEKAAKARWGRLSK